MRDSNNNPVSISKLIKEPVLDWLKALLGDQGGPSINRIMLENNQKEAPPLFLPGRPYEPLYDREIDINDDDKINESSYEILSWAESCTAPELTRIVADTIIKFQYENTIIEEKDSLPIPWGIISYLAPAAAYNALYILNSILRGIMVEKGAHEMAYSWLITTCAIIRKIRSLTEEDYNVLLKDFLIPIERALKKERLDNILKEIQCIKPRSGDFILLHSFYKGFLKFYIDLDKKRSNKRLKKDIIQSIEASNRGIFGRLSQLLFQTGILSKSERRRGPITSLDMTIFRLEQLIKNWKNISPLTKVLDNSLDEHDVKSLSIVFSEPNTEGFQYWLIKKIVPLCSLFDNRTPGQEPGEDLFSPNTAIFLPQAILETAKSSTDSGDRQKPWEAYLSLVRFYSHWLEMIPPLQDIEKRAVFPTTEQKDRYREPFKPFFEPWVELKRECERLKSSLNLYRAGDIQLTLSREYNELQKEWDKPVEKWHDIEVKTPAQKLQCLHNYFLNVRGMTNVNERHIQGGNE